VEKQKIKVGEAIIGEVAQMRQPVLVEDGLNDPRLPKVADPFMQIRTIPIRLLSMGIKSK
jgi:hypothetical protein